MKGKVWYDEICHLGMHEGIGMITTTSSKRYASTIPSDLYVSVIGIGLKEHYQFNDDMISHYLGTKKKSYSYNDLIWQAS